AAAARQGESRSGGALCPILHSWPAASPHLLLARRVQRRDPVRQMNERPMRRLGISRRVLFEAIERPLLRRLPAAEYVYAEWRLARVGLDYHVEIESFFYSVPHS